MTEIHNHLDSAKHHELDSVLDAALAKYAAVEPRAGLEDRVLANLRAEPTRVPGRAWWRWSVASALAAVLVVAFALAWRSGKRLHPVAEIHPSPTVPSAPKPATRLASNGGEKQIRRNQAHSQKSATLQRPAVHAQPEAIASTGPKLDQFPSPRPLSEQEKILLDYVERFPEEAVRIAEAQTALARREELEMYGPPATQTKPQDHEKTE